MKVLIDNGHGVNTPGKCSPDGRLREYAYAREIAERLEKALKECGVEAIRITPEEYDVSLSERCRRANKYGSKGVVLVSIHCNAAGADGKWHDAHGWAAYVSKNASVNSKTLARCLIQAAKDKGLSVREYAHQAPYWTQNLAICRDTKCPAVLTENLFQDNKADVDYLLSEEGKQAIVAVHIQGIMDYIKKVG